MQQDLVLQRIVENPPKWELWIFYTFVWVVLGFIMAYFFSDSEDGWIGVVLFFLALAILSLVALSVVKGRFKHKKECVMLEAMGEYEKAMVLASKYVDPQLITLFRQRYASQLAQETTPQSTQSNNSEQSASVINIHNVQTQQGPTEINVQDSVVTDWNQR